MDGCMDGWMDDRMDLAGGKEAGMEEGGEGRGWEGRGGQGWMDGRTYEYTSEGFLHALSIPGPTRVGHTSQKINIFKQ